MYILINACQDLLHRSLAQPETPMAILATFLAIALAVVSILRPNMVFTSFPIVNGTSPLKGKRLEEFYQQSRSLFQKGWQASNIFQVMAHVGPVTVFPCQYADEVGLDKRFASRPLLHKDFFTGFSGFELFDVDVGHNILKDSILLQMTRSLETITGTLSDEIASFLSEQWLEKDEWHELSLHASAEQLIRRISGLLFYGPELRDDKAWLEATDNYFNVAAAAMEDLRAWPPALRTYVHWFLPSCRKMRSHMHTTRALIDQVINARREMAQNASQKPVREYNDAIEWLEKTAKGREYDAAMGPLMMTVVHSTIIDVVAQLLQDLSERPELVKDLRQEIIDIQPHKEGWLRRDLRQLKLLDSVLKESMRLKPVGLIPMQRVTTETVTLSDGSIIPKKTHVGVAMTRTDTQDIYPDPEAFDGYRYLKLRDRPGFETIAQFAATSPIHVGFGHGPNACPGRWFAEAELKIIICHMLMKYDIKAIGRKAEVQTFRFEYLSDPEAKIMVRRRKEEGVF